MRTLSKALVLSGLLISAAAFADGAGTLDDANQKLHYDSQVWVISNPSGGDTPVICEGYPTCDTYTLTVNVSDTIRLDPNVGNFSVEILMAFGNAQSDFDMYMYDSAGNQIGSSTGSFGAQEAIFKPLEDLANGVYTIVVIPFVAVPSDTHTLDIALTGLTAESKNGFLGVLGGGLGGLLLLPLAAAALLRRR